MSSSASSRRLKNGQVIPFSEVPCLPMEAFRQEIFHSVELGGRISSLFGMEPGGKVQEKPLRLVAIMAFDTEKTLQAFSTEVGNRYPALTTECPQAHMFERELAEQWGVVPEGHPWLRPARFHPPFREGNNVWPEIPGHPHLSRLGNFFRVQGDDIHEVAVGPVHAGVIEPGHFRFQCNGEKVFHLEISLGYQHRGIEKKLIGGPDKRTFCQFETIAGDTTIGHALAFCQAIEALNGWKVPRRAHALRAVALELERLANHTGDLGALGGDVGFLPTASFCGRIRGDFLNMTALLCGSRLGRHLLAPGGVRFDLEPERLAKLTKELAQAGEDARVAVQLLWDTPAVMSRFENTGVISRETCRTIGMVGPAARACGCILDVRRDFPLGQYDATPLPPLPAPEPERTAGDVEARALMRWTEVQSSLAFLQELLPNLPLGAVFPEEFHKMPENHPSWEHLPPDSMVVSLVEGWRGEICHTVVTDSQGRFARYKIVDPSFHNWLALGLAMRNQEISDFPLCNKSFNLSYCGFDL